MHCLLTGIVPVIPCDYKPLRQHNPLVSKGLEYIVMHALEMDVQDRYKSAEEMKKALEKLSDIEINTPTVLDIPSHPVTEIEERKEKIPYNSDKIVKPIKPVFTKKLNLALISIIVSVLFIIIYFLFFRNSGYSFSKMAQTLAEEKKYNEALVYYDKAIEINPKDINSLQGKRNIFNSQGDDFRKNSDYVNAMKYYEKALSIDPDYINSIYGKGMTFYHQDDFKNAIKCFDRVLEINPEYASALYSKGNSIYSINKNKEGFKYYTKAEAIKNMEENDDFLLSKGDALYFQKKYDEAIKCFDKVIEINSEYKYAWTSKGNALKRQKKYNEAIKCFDRAINIDPEYKDSWMGKGNILNHQGEYNEAIKCYDKAIKIDSGYASALNGKGWALTF